MKISTGLTLPLAALFIVFLFMPGSAMAGTANCPVEPKANVAIASGDVYAGANCVLNTPGNIDSFVFNANSGDTYQLVADWVSGGSNICVTLYDPNSVVVFPSKTNPNNCSNAGVVNAVVDEQTITTTGQYKMVINEPDSGTTVYALSLERINPVPPGAQPIVLAKAVDGSITATSQDVFTLAGVSTGTYQVALTWLSGTTNACIYLFYPGAAAPAAAPDQGCTNAGVSNTYQFDFKPPTNGTYMVLINGAGNDGTASYTFEVSCLTGNCTPPPPSCTLTDALSYNASTSTLTMNFTVGNTYATSWHTWLIHQNASLSLFSVAQPITKPPVAIVKTTTLPKEGVVGVLSTLSTSAKGIVCSSFAKLSTGTP